MGRVELNVSLSAAMAVLTGMMAQAMITIGPIPYTMQNFAFVLAGLILEPKYAFLSQVLYLALIGLGLPFASGFRGGLAMLVGYTAGYLWGFPIASFLISSSSRAYLRGRSLASATRRDMFVLWLLSAASTIPVYLLGFLVFFYYAAPGTSLFSWSTRATAFLGLHTDSPLLLIFLSTVLIFIPEDLLVDHVLALMASKVMARLLLARGAMR